MSRLRVRALFSSALALVWLSVPALTMAQTKLETKPISAVGVSGGEMYKTYCASCHGLDAKGKGPASAALKVPATDLTKIAAKNGGKFDKDKVLMSLGAMPASGAHGTTDMPVWGDVFRGSRQTDAMVQLRLTNLVDHLAKLQDPPPAKPAKAAAAATKEAKPELLSVSSVRMNDGPEMFKLYCGSCHGLDGKGTGPVAKNLKSRPSDLTLLARANGGKFPANKVLSILGEMPGTEAHGSKEMPVWGDVLRNRERPDAVKLRLTNITTYLKGIQVP